MYCNVIYSSEVKFCRMNMKIPYFIILLALYLVSELSEAQQRFNCKKPSLRNGRARIRSRGRLVRFRCKKRFKLYGSKVALCVNGKWNFPTPICVAAGKKCSAVKEENGLSISKQFNDGLLKFSCKSGLILEGKDWIYCDGSNWSSKVPQCIYKESKKSCDFETADLCGWIQDDSDSSYFDWTRTAASEMTHSEGTGPTSDHTVPDKDTGHYLFMEASKPRKRGDFTRLLSPYYAPTRDGLCLEFWYHMHGPDGEKNVGRLSIGIDDSDDNIVNPTNMWNIFGNQGNVWNKGSLAIGKRASFYQIVITGTRGDDHRGDIAVDDFSIKNCTDDVNKIESTAVTTTSLEIRTVTKSLNSRTNQTEQPADDTVESTSLGSSDGTQEPADDTVESTSLGSSDGTQEPAGDTVESTSLGYSDGTQEPADDTVESTSLGYSDGTQEGSTSQVTSRSITDYRSPSHATSVDMNGTTTTRKTVLTSRTINTSKRSTSSETNVEISTYYLLTSRVSKYFSTGATIAASHSTHNSTQEKVTTSNKPTKVVLTTESHTIMPVKKTTNQSIVTSTTISHIRKQNSTTFSISTPTTTSTPSTPTTTAWKYSNSIPTSTMSSSSSIKQKPSTSLSNFTIKTTNLPTTEIITMSPSDTLTDKTNKDKTTYTMVAPQTIPTSMSKTTIGYSAFNTSSLTTPQDFDSNLTINEVIITTVSTNDTDIPNVLASNDPPVRPLMIGLGVGVAIGLVIVIVGSYLWVKRRRKKEQECDEMMPITGTGSHEW